MARITHSTPAGTQFKTVDGVFEAAHTPVNERNEPAFWGCTKCAFWAVDECGAKLYELGLPACGELYLYYVRPDDKKV